MFPTPIKNNAIYCASAYTVFFNKVLYFLSQNMFLSNFKNFIICKNCFRMIFPFKGFNKTDSPRMFGIISFCNVFQVRKMIIDLIAVLMICGESFWFLANKSRTNNVMNIVRPVHAVLIEIKNKVSTAIVARFYNSSFYTTLPSLISSNSTMFRNAIPSFITNNFAPFFFHIISKVKGLLSVCVSRTVSFLHLLKAQNLDIKNPISIRKLIISLKYGFDNKIIAERLVYHL